MNVTTSKPILFSLVATALIANGINPAAGQITSLPPQPWPDNPISISFAPDFVEIGRYRNELTQHLNGQLSDADWKVEILRAFQAWARNSDLQFAVGPDSPRAFGIPGLAQGDPRFGDLRLGAFPQTYVLGNAVPYHPSAGVWAGDIFLDTNRTFFIDDGESGVPSNDEYDLYSVVLHEAGNALGLLDEESDPESVMFFAYLGTRQDLSALDIANIQSLYGPPSSDPWEIGSSNDEFATATEVSYGSEFPSSLVEVRNGRIQDEADVDFYRFKGTSLAEDGWVKLRAKGRSLLCGRITVFNQQFQEIATVSVEDPFRNSVGIEFEIEPGETLYVAIDWSGFPGFEFGDYQLAIDFNENAEEEFDENEDAGESEDEELDDELVDLMYWLTGLIDAETNANNTFHQAIELYTPLGAPVGSRYEVVSALATPADKDMFRFCTSADATGSLAIDLTPLGVDPAAIDVVLFDSSQRPVPVTRRIRVTGDVVVEAAGTEPNTTYYARVQSRGGNTLPGNYLLIVNVASRSTELEPIDTIDLSATAPDKFGDFTTYKTQLFRFDLSMTSPDASNQACQFTVYSDTGRVERVTSVRSGGTRTAFVWLQAGQHHFRFTARTRNAKPIADSVITLDGASVSDDEGPILIDPSGNPISGPQEPGTNPTPPPTWEFPQFLLGLIIPLEHPW